VSVSALISLLVVAIAQQSPTITAQISSGWCSPNIANVRGNVTVTCIGVDPRALKRLNFELNQKNLQLADKIRKSNEWAKKYKELEARLSQAGDDSLLSRQAEEYLREGELEKAGTILDQILGREEKEIDQVAANHYNRALLFELQFRPLDALSHLKIAYQYRPQQVKYGEEYSHVLLNQNDFDRAEPVLLATLDNARHLATANPAVYQPDLAKTLNLLAVVYDQTQRLKEAEAAFQEALGIYRELAKKNPTTYQRDVAETLNNLAILYRNTQRLKEAETAYQEALDIDRELAKENPAVYQPHLAKTLNNLAVLYRDAQRLKEAEAVFQEALNIFRQLAKANPAAYQLFVATTLSNLAVVYDQTQRLEEAEAAYQEALGIDRELATFRRKKISKSSEFRAISGA